MMFIDRAEIIVQAGGGGNGANSFYRDKFIRPAKKKGKGRPDGGDGGKGGDVIIRPDAHLHTLLDFYYRKHFSAKKGLNGGSKGKKGKDGENYLIRVPLGTLVKDLSTNCILGDLTNNTESLIVAKGGQGGKGNTHAKLATPGAPGEKRKISLELKLIADVGIMGLPNSGKSTLLSAISEARPKIAPYPFTTKSPVLGIVKRKDFSFVALEIPGLVKDAHLGRGLGFEFLRHIERTRILIHLLDMSGGSNYAAIEDFRAINRELRLYDARLLDKSQIVVANKMDLENSRENLKIFKQTININPSFAGKGGVKVIPISAQKKHNLKELIDEIEQRL